MRTAAERQERAEAALLLERTRQLEELTQEYAAFSRSAFGLALVATGGWQLAFMALALVSEPWGLLGQALTPLVFLLLFPRTRAWYQRRGVALQAEAPPASWVSRRWFSLFLIALQSAGLILILPWDRLHFSGLPPWVVWASSGAALAAVPVLAWRRTSGRDDVQMVWWVAFGSGMALLMAFSASRDTFVRWGLGLVAAFFAAFVWQGAWEHRRHRALERRLAALRESR